MARKCSAEILHIRTSHIAAAVAPYTNIRAREITLDEEGVTGSSRGGGGAQNGDSKKSAQMHTNRHTHTLTLYGTIALKVDFLCANKICQRCSDF